MPASRDELGSPLAEVEWHWLRLHLERDAVIVVAPDLDLEEAAAQIAADNSAAAAAWIAEGRLTKPTLEQLASWNAEPAKRFRMVIVRPYVLIQDIPRN